LSDAEFLNLICRESGAGLLLDIENVYLNATNHGFDPYAFIDALRPGLVKEIHMAGGITVNDKPLAKPLLADSHSHPVPDAALDLLEYALRRQAPSVIILERDDRLEAGDEILDDVARIRARVTRSGADFDGFESHSGVVAELVPATANIKAQSKDNRGGRDKPGDDAEEAAAASTWPKSSPGKSDDEELVGSAG
jgi:hypothetical protein